ncbi:MAG TPA: hypothetical protein VLK23_13600 [Thermodesulfobacteriota bacterium]|nr:hypothetical protein [Thermodesulfobacteriota bacterium]
MKKVATTFISLCFLLLLGLGAQAQEYQRPKPDANGGPPTYADLQTFDGVSRSLTVQLLNLTPYDIQFVHKPGVTWSIISADEAEMQDRNNYSKSFMFVPAGIPSLIPAAPQPGDPGYDPTTTHPYSMVFSWDDRGGFVVDNWVKWTVKGVRYISACETDPSNPDQLVCHYDNQDVDLGLWMYRIKPTSKLVSSYLYTLVKDSLKLLFDTFKLTLELENPKAWVNEFLAWGELAKDAAEFAKENSQENDGNKMWVASYVIPNPKSVCVTSGSNCTPATMTPDDSGDAIVSLWPAAYAGPPGSCKPELCSAAEGELVVSVHVLRGQKAKQCDPTWYPNVCPLGSEPVVMITVMRVEDFAGPTLAGASPNLSSGAKTPRNKVRLFLLQAGAGRIRELLEKQGRTGLLELRSIIEELDPAQQGVLREMIRTMGTGRLPTQQERQLVHLLADELKARLK